MSEQDQINNSEEERLQYECEQAFLRLRFKEPSGAEEWKKFGNRIGQAKKKTRSYRLLVAASVAAAALVFAVFLLWNKEEQPLPEKMVAVVVKTEIDAQVSVMEGKRMSVVPKGRVEKEGVVLSSTEANYTSAKKVRRNIISIPRGQVYKIVLSDGTEVWMNASSRLSFPTRFSGSRRVVTLEGEAYFKVAPDVHHPFIIVTDKVTTEVMGTEFNVRAYRDSEAHVTLVKGSVKVHLPQNNREVLLRPGDDAICTGDELRVQQVNVSYYTYWKEGYFYYDNVNLGDILKDLGRWYNVTIAMEQDSVLVSQRLHFVADRSETIDAVIENLNLYQYLSVTKEGDNITVRRRE